MNTLGLSRCCNARVFVDTNELGNPVYRCEKCGNQRQPMGMTGMTSKNLHVVSDFAKFCYEHPEMSFWRALRAWAEVECVLVKREGSGDTEDTFNFEGRDA